MFICMTHHPHMINITVSSRMSDFGVFCLLTMLRTTEAEAADTPRSHGDLFDAEVKVPPYRE